MKNQALFTSEKDYWETPQALFNELDREFHFTLDPCSTHENAKCQKHFTTVENGLLKSWGGETVFCNPPYGRNNASLWVEKCYLEAQKPNTTVVLLIPARTDTKWFHKYIYKKHEVRFLKGRIKFELGGVAKNSATFPSMLVIMKNKNI